MSKEQTQMCSNMIDRVNKDNQTCWGQLYALFVDESPHLCLKASFTLKRMDITHLGSHEGLI